MENVAMTLTRRSFLTGLITAPAIVAACNIMKVRPIDNLFQIGPFVDTDTLMVEHLRGVAQVMKEANIPPFDYVHYACHISQARLEEGRRRFRAANPHYGCYIDAQMAMDFL